MEVNGAEMFDVYLVVKLRGVVILDAFSKR